MKSNSDVAFFCCAVLAACAVVAVVFWAVRAMDRADAADHRREQTAFIRAERVCGSRPLRVVAHGSWSFGPWLEVRCPDGTTVAIEP